MLRDTRTPIDGSSIVHADLQGLESDDHKQYALTTGAERANIDVNDPKEQEILVYDSTNRVWYNTINAGGSGTSGTSGTSGSSGSSGIAGTSGSSGSSGSSGATGVSGTSGTSGESGTSGSSGTSGLTPSIYVDSTSGDVYFTDPTRGKDLGVAIIQQDVGRNSANTTDQYLRSEGDTPTNQNGFVLPWNATLISMSMSGKLNTQTWSVDVRKNGGGVAQDSLTITNQYSNYSDTNNIDFNAGDRVQVYCNGSSIDYPHATLFFRRRY